MVRPPYFDSNGLKKGAWNKEEDIKLKAFILEFGLITTWRLVPLFAGLRRSGKSCRLRWVNYLRSDLKKEKFTKNEEDLLIELHDRLGNKWSTIATYFPGRTDNDIKNYWNAHIKKRLYKQEGAIRPKVIRPQIAHEDQSSKINYFITTDHQEKPASENVFLQGLFSTEDPQNIHALNSITYPYCVPQTYHDKETCLSQLNIDDLPPILEEEFGDFGLCQNDTPTFSDSSNGVTTSRNSSVQSLANFWSELLEKGTIDIV